MNWNLIAGNWQEFKGKVNKQWSKITHVQLDEIAGNRNGLADTIQRVYGISRHAAEWQLSGWQERQHELLPTA